MDLKRKLTVEYAKEEAFWAKKSKCKWLKEEDKNTAYFHMRVASRRRRNRLSRLEKEQGGWCETDEEIGEEVAKYYQNLFNSSWPIAFEEIFQGIPRTITEQMNLQLTRPVTEKKIKQALFSMHPNKAPGPYVKWDSALCGLKGAYLPVPTLLISMGINQAMSVPLEELDRELKSPAVISYLFLTDDSLIFCKDSGKKASEITRILQIYEQASRQKAKYLGLPMVIRRSKNSTFKFLKDKMIAKLQGQKGKMLSNAGKEVLLKSVALVLPSYTMSVFKLSDGLLDQRSRSTVDFSTTLKEEEVVILNWSLYNGDPEIAKFTLPFVGFNIDKTSWKIPSSFFGKVCFTSYYWEWVEDIFGRYKEVFTRVNIFEAVYASRFSYDRCENIL
ncbi:uncharacterized protein [Coffea arabica]|uniref:Reverse transcriptase domain-containing protein n=1 Tax=Coffea arabica TaxID=13443 RepID=A0ABM4UFY8_COFAR